jgi:hypothetical protein
LRNVKSGGVLLSHTVSSAVPSALKGLASGFGMGPGVSLSLLPPKHYGIVNRSCPAAWWAGALVVIPELHSGRVSMFVVKSSAY